MGLYADENDKNKIIRKAKEKIRKIGMGWGYKYPFIGRTNKADNNLEHFWVDLYVCKELPPLELREKATNIKDYSEYSPQYICTANGPTLSHAYIGLLRDIELKDISVNSLRRKKKEKEKKGDSSA